MPREQSKSISTPEEYWDVFRERFLKKYGGRGFVVLERESSFGARHMYYPSLVDLRIVYRRYPEDIDSSAGTIIKDLEKELESWEKGIR